MKDLILAFLRISLLLLACLALSACTHTNHTQLKTIKKSKAAAGFNVQLGLGYLEQGNVQRAKIKLLLALQQAPNWPPALDAMAYFLEKTGDVEEAKNYYHRSLAIAPHDGSVLNNYGTFLCRQKQYKEADKYFLQAVNDPGYLTVAEAYENAGLCSLAVRDDKKAMQYFHKSLLQDPSRAVSLYELAKLAYKQQRYKQAKGYLDKFIASAQPNPKVLLLAYQTALKLKDKNAALKYVQFIKAQFPNSSEYQQVKAMVN